MNSLIKVIHVAKTKLNISDDNYRELLHSFGVVSSKELSQSEAIELLNVLNKLGFEYKKNTKKKKVDYRKPARITKEWATQRQINFIAGLWAEKSREKDVTSLDRFCKRITGIDKVEWLRKEHVQRIILAIQSL